MEQNQILTPVYGDETGTHFTLFNGSTVGITVDELIDENKKMENELLKLAFRDYIRNLEEETWDILKPNRLLKSIIGITFTAILGFFLYRLIF